jgi:DNA-directed RNA polymerase subunit RPC12/RpoP
MNALLANTMCLLFPCLPQPETCVCARCGRTNHLWAEMPSLAIIDYEFRGITRKGKMVYSQTALKHYTCSRCGESYKKTCREHVYH